MRRIAILLVLLVVGCGKSAKEQLKEDMEAENLRRGLDPEPPKREALPPTTKKEVKAPDPEPTTPAEIEDARKKAMIEGRDKDVIRFCEMGKIDNKSDPQAILGCTLSACRVMQTDKAKSWAAALTASGSKDAKQLYDQAIKTCMANKVVL